MKRTRRTLQLGFLLLIVGGVFVVRGNAERWCPFGGVEALYTYIQEGNLTCSLAVSNFYILGGVLLATLILRRAFCGYACPVGTISDWLQHGADRLGLSVTRVPANLDRLLSMLKYPLLVVILFFTYRTAELIFRGFDPCYALISRHGDDITLWTYAVSGGLILASLFLTLPFCRWLCPLAAVLNPLSRVGVARIRRNGDTCLGCGECGSACPMAIPVDKLREVKAARCMSCMRCVDVCPGGTDGTLTWGPPRQLGRRWPGGVLVGVLLACTASAVAASHFFPLPSFVLERGTAPPRIAVVDLRVTGLNCRGNATLLMYFLERNDAFALPGYVKLEAWPGPGMARARVTYNPAAFTEEAVKQAVTEPYYDPVGEVWRFSPFEVAGYDSLGP